MIVYFVQLQVLQRKTEEAARATKKLKELIESRKVNAQKENRSKLSQNNFIFSHVSTFRNFLISYLSFQINP